jgi:hypothetical protein
VLCYTTIVICPCRAKERKDVIMRKILSMILCVVMLMSLALVANADAINMADGLKTEVTVKKANPDAVKKDGVIGAGEYEEVEVNRDPESSDLLLPQQ